MQGTPDQRSQWLTAARSLGERQRAMMITLTRFVVWARSAGVVKPANLGRMRATIWLLDVTHRARRLTCEVPPGARPMVAMEDAVERELGVAAGVSVGARNLETAPEGMFLLPRAGTGDGWAALPAWAADDERGFDLYVEVMLGGWSPPTRALDVFAFGNNPALAAALAHLVVKGQKRGTTGWLEAAERDGVSVPRAGLVSIITDGFGYPLCAIQTERVEHLRFADITAAHAWGEAEGDRTLDDYREGHLRYFHAEAARLGLVFTEDAIVFYEHFRVLAVLGRADR